MSASASPISSIKLHSDPVAPLTEKPLAPATQAAPSEQALKADVGTTIELWLLGDLQLDLLRAQKEHAGLISNLYEINARVGSMQLRHAERQARLTDPQAISQLTHQEFLQEQTALFYGLIGLPILQNQVAQIQERAKIKQQQIDFRRSIIDHCVAHCSPDIQQQFSRLAELLDYQLEYELLLMEGQIPNPILKIRESALGSGDSRAAYNLMQQALEQLKLKKEG